MPLFYEHDIYNMFTVVCHWQVGREFPTGRQGYYLFQQANIDIYFTRH